MNIWIIIAGIYLSFSLVSLFIREFRNLTLNFIKEASDKIIFGSDNIIFRWKNILYFTFSFSILFLLIICLLITLPISAAVFLVYPKKNRGSNNNIKINLLKNQKYIFTPKFIIFNEDLPFTPSNKQIIYVEDSFNFLANEFIINHYTEISTLLTEKGYNFCYIPFFNKENITNEIIEYYNPRLKKEDIISKEIIRDLTYTDFLAFSKNKEDLKCGLLRYKCKEDNFYQFSYFEFTEFTEKELWAQLHTYICQIGDSNKYYSIGKHDFEDKADSHFSTEAKQIAEEIKERIDKLRQIGINEMALKSFIFPKPKLSKLLVTKDWRIFLSDFNNKEIIMYPLPKAVFFLFLKHPEGIIFKHLPDYKEELFNIYSKLTNKDELNDINESIRTVIDPTKNAINEKCSRIRESFIKEFDESIAINYIISGDRGEPKKIIINRDLVTFEMKI